jgi:type VI secretion system protein ImpL
VAVTVEMRIVRRAGSGSEGGGDWQRGLQLPERVAGGTPAAPAPAPAATAPAAAQTTGGAQ